MPWITLEGIKQKQSPGFFYVFWELRRKWVWKMCSGLCGHKGLLLFGTAAGLEKSRVNNHLSKPPFVDNPTANLLSKKKKIYIHIFFLVQIKYGLTQLSCHIVNKAKSSNSPFPVGTIQEWEDGGSRTSLFGLYVWAIIWLVAVTWRLGRRHTGRCAVGIGVCLRKKKNLTIDWLNVTKW